MKRFWGFVQKEWYHIMRDRRTLLILFGMPIAQILLFGFAVTNEIKEARIAVYDPSGDAVSRELTRKLLASGYFVLDQQLTHRAEIEPAFRSGAIKMVVAYPDQLDHRLQHEGHATVQLLADATDPNTANTLVAYASQIVADYQQSQGTAERPLQIEISSRMRYKFPS